MKSRLATPFSLSLTVGLLSLSGMGMLAWAQQENFVRGRTTEVFRVSQVGRPHCAEDKPRLLELYNIIAKWHDENVAAERSNQKKVYKGESVRVIQNTGDSDANGTIYTCAYNGTPCFVSIPGSRMKAGRLSPALLLEADGEHTTTITRKQVTKKTVQQQPSLETIAEGDVPTFFGLPIFDTPTGTGGGAGPKEVVIEEVNTVREEKKLPKYKATVSTELLSEGPPLMSTQLLVSLLKNGEVYTVQRPEARRCQECRGFGRVTDNRPQAFRSNDGKMPCPECRGPGKIKWEVTYKVVW